MKNSKKTKQKIQNNVASSGGNEKMLPFSVSRRESERNQGVLSQGAEALIIFDNNLIIKQRIPKSYRLPEIDDKIRKLRTRNEAKLLEKASKVINTPKIICTNEKTKEIKLEFIQGKKLSEFLEKFQIKEQEKIMNQLGEDIAKLHEANIIHGDLTTSNMILFEDDLDNNEVLENNKNSCETKEGGWSGMDGGLNNEHEPKLNKGGIFKIYLIDFGLGFHSHKLEDKAVDIHLLKQALEAKHFQNWEKLFNSFVKGYKKNSKHSEKIFQRLKAVEKRGKYKGH